MTRKTRDFNIVDVDINTMPSSDNNYLFSPLDDTFEPKVPPLSIIVNMAPQAHTETKFFNGHAVTDVKKRDYMIALAGCLRGWKDWFKDVRRIHLDVVFVFERPQGKPDGYTRAEWNDEDLELKKINPPDLDNCEKSFQDCISNHPIQREQHNDKNNKSRITRPAIYGAGIIDDDSYIVSKKVAKIYHRVFEKPRIEFTLSEVSRYFIRS